jgi:hypothetical protein
MRYAFSLLAAGLISGAVPAQAKETTAFQEMRRVAGKLTAAMMGDPRFKSIGEEERAAAAAIKAELAKPEPDVAALEALHLRRGQLSLESREVYLQLEEAALMRLTPQEKLLYFRYNYPGEPIISLPEK